MTEILWPKFLRSVDRAPIIWAVETLSGGKTKLKTRTLAIILYRGHWAWCHSRRLT